MINDDENSSSRTSILEPIKALSSGSAAAYDRVLRPSGDGTVMRIRAGILLLASNIDQDATWQRKFDQLMGFSEDDGT